MAINNISSTIQEFRQNVLGRGGPQLASLYEVYLNSPRETIVAYPLNIILPGRQYVYYEHDLWGPNRKVPYKRGYTQCHMTFIVYQDWAERTFIEQWMDIIIKNNGTSVGRPVSSGQPANADPGPSNTAPNSFDSYINAVNGYFNGTSTVSGTIGPASQLSNDTISQAISSGANSSFSTSNYKDFIDYYNGVGSIQIRCVNSQRRSSPNVRITLKEAFPAAISQMSMVSEATGYATFNVTFQFNNYFYNRG